MDSAKTPEELRFILMSKIVRVVAPGTWTDTQSSEAYERVNTLMAASMEDMEAKIREWYPELSLDVHN